MKQALVTGANGFVGRRLCQDLQRAGWRVVACVRGDNPRLPDTVVPVVIDDLASFDGAGGSPGGVDLSATEVIFHLAARAHRVHELGNGSCAEQYESDNLTATKAVYRWATRLEVKHLVFLSSIKVLGDTSVVPLRIDAPYRPADEYARSKVAAEQFLIQAAAAGPGVSIIRPPLVYGPGVKGNFARLIELTASSWPLPLASAHARRSLVALGNLTHLLLRLAQSPPMGFRIYHVRDNEELSVRELVLGLARALHRKKLLLPLPPSVAAVLARLLHQRVSYERLFCPLRVDADATLQMLHWSPPYAVAQALQETVDAYTDTRLKV